MSTPPAQGDTERAPDVFAELAVLKQLLREVDLPDWHTFSGSWLAEFFLGVTLPRKQARIVDAVFEGKRTRHIVAGSRGSGKSFLDALVEFLIWCFRDFDVVNLGGSEIQAQNVHAYFKGFVEQFRQNVREFDMGGRVLPPTVLKDTMEKTVRAVDPYNLHTPTLYDQDGEPITFVGAPLAKDSQAFVAVLAATEKRVRGPHAGSERRGGLLVVDEEGEVSEDIFNAAKYTVNTASPSIILRTSTYHNALGTFGQDFEDPDAKGFERHRISVFDIAKPCPWAKTVAGDWDKLRAGTHRAPGDDHRSVIDLPVLQPDCSACPVPEYFRDARFRTDPKTGEQRPLSPPWCAGAAAYAEHGWIGWDEILRLFRERPNDEDFEVELLGFRPSSAGYVIVDRDKLRACVVPDEECRYDPQAGECVLTIDWGLSGTCAVHVMQNHPELNQPYGERWVFQVDDLGHAGITRVGEHCQDMRERYGCVEVWSDASHPYENHYLATELGFDVHLCYFGKMKEHGAGAINAHVEHGALKIPRGEGKPLMDSLNGWRRDKMGQIVKRNDHHADSLLCGAWRYYDMVMFMLDGSASQPRRAAVANAAARSSEPQEDARHARFARDGGGDDPPARQPARAFEVAQVSAWAGNPPGANRGQRGSVGSESQADVLPPTGHSLALPAPPAPLSPTRTEQIIAEQAQAARQSLPTRRFR